MIEVEAILRDFYGVYYTDRDRGKDRDRNIIVYNRY